MNVHADARTIARLALAALGAMFLQPSRLSAQNPAATIFTACPSPADVFNARQVQVQAKPIADSASARPVDIVVLAAGSRTPATVALTVDTLGRVEPGSLVRLSSADTLAWRAAESSYHTWRFRPAVASGCKVRQRVLAVVAP